MKTDNTGLFFNHFGHLNQHINMQTFTLSAKIRTHDFLEHWTMPTPGKVFCCNSRIGDKSLGSQ